MIVATITLNTEMKMMSEQPESNYFY